MTENIYSFLSAQSSPALYCHIPDLTHSALRDAARSWALAAVGCAGGSALKAAGRAVSRGPGSSLRMWPPPVGPQSFLYASRGLTRQDH